jgi:hypothetical protein
MMYVSDANGPSDSVPASEMKRTTTTTTTTTKETMRNKRMSCEKVGKRVCRIVKPRSVANKLFVKERERERERERARERERKQITIVLEPFLKKKKKKKRKKNMV